MRKSLILITIIALLTQNAMADRPGTGNTFELTLSGGSESYQAQFSRTSVRGSNYTLMLQGADGSFEQLDPPPEQVFLGHVPAVPGAFAAAVVRPDGEVFYRVVFADGREWINAGGETRINQDNERKFNWPNLVPKSGHTAPGLSVAEVGVDLPSHRFIENHDSNVAEAAAMIDYSVLSANLVYMRQAGIAHHLSRVVIRGHPAHDPYAHLCGTDPNCGTGSHNKFLDGIREQWGNELPAAPYDLALVVRKNSAAGVAVSAAIGEPPGYSSNDATKEGDFSQPWRHEAGHNWGLSHYDGGNPEGPTINSGNQLARMSGPEQALVATTRDKKEEHLDRLPPPTFKVPPSAATDAVFLNAEHKYFVIDVLANDHDANGESLSLVSVTATPIAGTLGGTAEAQTDFGPDRPHTIAYYRPEGSGPGSGFALFEYHISDASGQESVGYLFVRLVDSANHYAQNFDNITDGASEFSDNSFVTNVHAGTKPQVVNSALQLTPDEGNQFGAYTLPLTGLQAGFTASFDFKVTASGKAADAFALNFGSPMVNRLAAGLHGFERGLTVEFNTYAKKGYRLFVDAQELPGGHVANSTLADGQPHKVVVTWHGSSLSMKVDGTVVYDRIDAADFVPESQHMLAFSARTIGLSQAVLIDNIEVEVER